MAIALGKDCTLSIGGSILSARNATFEVSGKTIDVDPFGSRIAAVYSTGWDASFSAECNDIADIGGLFSMAKDGLYVSVSGGAGAWQFDAVITRITETDPIDGVATFNVEGKMTLPIYRPT